MNKTRQQLWEERFISGIDPEGKFRIRSLLYLSDLSDGQQNNIINYLEDKAVNGSYLEKRKAKILLALNFHEGGIVIGGYFHIGNMVESEKNNMKEIRGLKKHK